MRTDRTYYGRDIRTSTSWSFETDRFFVGFFAEPEEMDPADTFCFDEDIEAVRSGSVEYFCARVSVYLKGDSDRGDGWIRLSSDYLGGCAYKRVSDFYEARGDYFTDMVSEAIREARATLKGMADVASTMRT